jgi:hypothetical protein
MKTTGGRSILAEHALGPRLWAALALILVYVLPIYWPPAATPLEAPSVGASLSERLFPGLPAAWVWIRLLALLSGALLLARPLADATNDSTGTGNVARAAEPQTIVSSAALVLAFVLLGAGLWASDFGRSAQIGYLAATFLPALVLFAAAPSRHRELRPPATVVAALAALMASWFLLRVVPAWHSPRAASATDMWLNFRWLMEAAASDRNLLASRSEISATDAWMLLAGVDLLGPGASLPAFPVVLTIGALWLLAGAAALAVLCGVTIHWWAGVVAAAALLFSPLCLSLALSPAPFGVPIAVGAAMLVMLWRFYTRRSAAALAGFAALASIGATQLHLLHVSLLGVAVAILLALERPRVRPGALAIALCGFLMPTVPGVRQLPSVDQMRQNYVSRHWQWAGLEDVLHEQRGLLRHPTPDELMYTGVAAPLDIQLGTLLMPFAVPRTALRLIGDVLLEPFSTALAATGLAIAFVRGRRDRLSAAGIAVLAAALLPSFAGSQYDRISLTRAILLPVSMGAFAALAFHALARTLVAERHYARAAALLAAMIALSGCAIFDAVNPRILGASAMELALEATGTSEHPPTVVIAHNVADTDWLHVERIAAYVPSRRLMVARFAEKTDLATPPADGAEVFLWSPRVEEDTGFSRAICATMPSATLYVLRSRSGLSRLYAAARDATTWLPSIDPTRVTTSACGSGFTAASAPR